MENAQVRNLLTGKVFEVKATTEHPASSYNKKVWVTEEGDAIGQVGLPLLGYELIEPPPRT